MSKYLMALEPVAKERYLEKLRLLSMSEKDDPYASSNEMKFVDNSFSASSSCTSTFERRSSP